ncbi:MAG: phage holin family protein [Bacteroidetes bacterium]|nr:phage holin family protein [Bacteroidota bacterium]
MKYIFKIIVTSFAVVITAYLLNGIHVPNFTTAIVISIVLTLLNIFVRPLLIMLTIPATIFSMGLFLLVINAFIILLASALVPEFKVDSFWWALAFSIILSIVSFILEIPEKIKSGKIVVKKLDDENPFNN